jgi:hypothetical protein
MSFRFKNPLVARNANLTPSDPHRRLEVYDPEGFMDRLNRTFRRRLSDRVEALFQEACLVDDLDTAEELLTVLVNMHERRRRNFGGERRISDEAVVKIREELARRKAAKRRQAN